MVICGSYMFGFSVSKDIEEKRKHNNDKRRTSTYISSSISSKTNYQGI
jgi:hypothetical protein